MCYRVVFFRLNFCAHRRRNCTVRPFRLTVNVFPNFRRDVRSEPVDCTFGRFYGPCFLYFDTRYGLMPSRAGWPTSVLRRGQQVPFRYRCQKILYVFRFFPSTNVERSCVTFPIEVEKNKFCSCKCLRNRRKFFFFRKQTVPTIISRGAVWKNPNNCYEEVSGASVRNAKFRRFTYRLRTV